MQQHAERGGATEAGTWHLDAGAPPYLLYWGHLHRGGGGGDCDVTRGELHELREARLCPREGWFQQQQSSPKVTRVEFAY